MLYAARWKCRTQKSPKIRHLGTIAQLRRTYIFATEAHIDNRKNLLNSNVSHVSLMCPQNMVNFGSLATEICWRVWGTPANFNRLRVLGALLHGTLVVSVSEALNRGRHLYSAGRPSRWHWPTFPVKLYFYMQLFMF